MSKVLTSRPGQHIQKDNRYSFFVFLLLHFVGRFGKEGSFVAFVEGVHTGGEYKKENMLVVRMHMKGKGGREQDPTEARGYGYERGAFFERKESRALSISLREWPGRTRSLRDLFDLTWELY